MRRGKSGKEFRGKISSCNIPRRLDEFPTGVYTLLDEDPRAVQKSPVKPKTSEMEKDVFTERKSRRNEEHKTTEHRKAVW